MTSIAIDAGRPIGRPNFENGSGKMGLIVFVGLLVVGVVFAAFSVSSDIAASHTATVATGAYFLLGLALLIALGFEFVNGFHDTANAVATVIYTNALPPTVAVLWSGVWNFLGVLVSSGAVAFGIISLLPVELILQVSGGTGFAMVFALLIAAIIWNLGTWWLGLPSSSSHTLIGSIIGVGLANQLMHLSSGTSGVDWGKAKDIGSSLLLSPLLGFACAAILMVVLKTFVKVPALYKEPVGNKPPPLMIRGLLVLTCTLVSFFHGSNDGQKGMGLIMLILIGTVPTAYALNRAMPQTEVAHFISVAQQADVVLVAGSKGVAAPADARAAVTTYVQSHTLTPATLPAIAALTGAIGNQVRQYGNLAAVPAGSTANVRNDMYLASEALRILDKTKAVPFSDKQAASLKDFRKSLDASTKFIPNWVKIAVAIALGLGTMVGWKRIVITVGEKIGKTHLTYAQGASAEIVAAAMIGAADSFGLPVSTTHVLSSGVAGTMTANGSGLQWGTLRNMLTAWVLTLPVSILLSGTLFFIFSRIFG
ncbi:MAG: anion permease [Sphingomonadales bacterium]|nr:anion permease [Sphingomonadales bacterium]